jgi:hypothetical protein
MDGVQLPSSYDSRRDYEEARGLQRSLKMSLNALCQTAREAKNEAA